MTNENVVTDAVLTALFRNWETLLRSLDVKQPQVEESFTRVVAAYSSPDRCYHTLEHIHQVLTTIQLLETEAVNLAAVQLAAWLHDVVYVPQAQDNEERSADYAQYLLQALGMAPDTIAAVRCLILATKQHQPDEDDLNSHVLLDADLAILSAPSIDYWSYTQAIRQEYVWLPDADYRVGRKRVLENFLQRDQIYFTPLMVEMAEQAARANIKAEILSL